MVSKEIVGAPLNFRGMMYAPTNEQGVVFLFANISNDLGFKVENVQTAFPDCTALRKVGPDKYRKARLKEWVTPPSENGLISLQPDQIEQRGVF
ncbi:hypothetical protein ES705_22908 [subsurface metagenome]